MLVMQAMERNIFRGFIVNNEGMKLHLPFADDTIFLECVWSDNPKTFTHVYCDFWAKGELFRKRSLPD